MGMIQKFRTIIFGGGGVEVKEPLFKLMSR